MLQIILTLTFLIKNLILTLRTRKAVRSLKLIRQVHKNFFNSLENWIKTLAGELICKQNCFIQDLKLTVSGNFSGQRGYFRGKVKLMGICRGPRFRDFTQKRWVLISSHFQLVSFTHVTTWYWDVEDIIHEIDF